MSPITRPGLLAATLLFLAFAGTLEAAERPEARTFSRQEVLAEVEGFFGEGAEGLADIIEKAFRDHGEPNAYIAGNEVSGAIGIGLRYGEGRFAMAGGETRTVYWQGPSIGFDFGAKAAKVFVLVYNLGRADDLFQRWPGVEGSLVFVGGVGMNYLRIGDTVLAPVRFGAGWRMGANIGYLNFSRKERMLPF
jgi:hypothetical protein